MVAATQGIPWLWILIGTGAACALLKVGPWGQGGALDHRGRRERAMRETYCAHCGYRLDEYDHSGCAPTTTPPLKPCPACGLNYPHSWHECAQGGIATPVVDEGT